MSTLKTSKIMERFPSFPEQPTHVVYSKKRVALWKRPSFKPVRVFTSGLNDGKIAGYVSDGTNLVVLDEGTGHNCIWAKVKLVDNDGKLGKRALYIRNDRIKPLPSTAPSAPKILDDKTQGNPRVPPITDWTSLNPNVSYFDESDSKYKVCVELPEYTSTGGSDIINRMKLACYKGLKIIFADNGKNSDNKFVAGYINDIEQGNIFQFCTAEEYFVDIRPNTFLKVLVTLPRKYLLPVENSKSISVVGGVTSNVRWDILENVVFKSSYKTNKFEDMIKKASTVLSTYGKQISSFQGTVVDYDGEAEAQNILKVIPPIKELFALNSLTPSPFGLDEVMELGWDSTLTLIYVSLRREDGGTIYFSKGLADLSDSVPFDSQRTQGYLWNLSEISKIDTRKLTWTDFLVAYTLPEPPVVTPSKIKDSVNFHENIGQIDSNTEPLAKKMAKPLNESPVKTYADKLKEDRNLDSLDDKFKLYQNRAEATDFVGDYIASCSGIENTLKKINTVDDAFDAVLDKINIADLISQCMDTLTSGLTNVQDLAEDVRNNIGDVGSGVGIGDASDVSLDYANDFDVSSVTNITTDITDVASGYATQFSDIKDVEDAIATVIDFVREYFGVDDIDPVLQQIEQFSGELVVTDGIGDITEMIISFTKNIQSKFITLGTLEPIPSVEDFGIDKSLTESLDKAQEKLSELTEFSSDPSVVTDSFSQGGSPKLPPSLAMSFPDSLPTQDVMASMGDAIEGALTTLLNEIFVAMVKSVLTNLTDSCTDKDGEGEQFGKANLNDMLEDSVPDTGAGQLGPPEAIDALMNSLGMDTGMPNGVGAPQSLTPSASPSKRNEVVSMLDDISLLLTPVEICSLINGNASGKTLRLVRSFILKSYPNLKITKKSQVIKFFRAFGTMIDSSICRVIESPTPLSPSYVIGDVLCKPAASEADILREELLNNRGGGITPDQVAMQLQKARQRKADAAKVLADFVNNGPLSDGFEPPPVFCQKGESGSSSASPDYNSSAASKRQKGLVDLSHDSIDYMTDKAVDLMFDPVYISFSSDATSYPSAFVKAPDASETIPVDTSSAFAISYYGSKSAAEDAANGGTEVDIPIGKPKIMPALRGTLLSMETEANVFGPVSIPENLETNSEYLFGSYGATIPLPTDVVDFSALSGMEDASEELKDAIQDLQSQTASVNWTFNYSEPFVSKNISLSDTPINYDIFLVEDKGTTSSVVMNYNSQETVSASLASTLSQDRYSYSSGTNLNVNIRKHKFASLLTNKISELAKAGFNSYEFYTKSGGFYDRINKDIIAYISNLVAASPFFKTIEIEGETLEGKKGPSSYRPIIEYLKLDPEPTLEQRREDCDPHLLNLKDLKKQLKEDMKKERCVDLSAPTDGSPAESMSDQEMEMMKLCVKTIVRTYMIDFYMRSVFSNSVFAPGTEPDDLYLTSLKSFIISDLESYDEPNFILANGELTPVGQFGTYKDEFLAVAYEITGQGREPDDDGDISTPLAPEALGEEALVSLIKEQYLDVHMSMRSRVNSLMLSDIESRFVLDYLPIINYTGSYVYSTGREYESLISEFQDTENIGEQVPWNKNSKINWSNGNLFLEPYYYVEYHDSKPTWWNDDEYGSFDIDITSPTQWSRRGVVNKQELKEIFEAMESAARPLLDFENPKNGILNSISRGYRLMWAPPSSSELKAEFENRPNAPTSDEVWNYMWSNLPNKFSLNDKFSLDRVAIEKCLVNFDITGGQASASSGSNSTYTYLYKVANTFPIIDSRVSITKEDYSTLSDNLDNDRPETHFYLISEHEDFRSFVDFMFPIKRYKSVMEVFCQQATSYDTMINGAMSSTKDELRRLFFAINSRGDYKQRDPAMDEVGGPAGLEKMMRNEFGLLDTPASPNSWNYNLPLGWGKSVKGLGFEAVAKATGEAVLKIFKKQAEKSDPNISIAHKLAMASKLVNLNIPTSAWSFMLLPANVFPLMPGPPIGPLGWVYHAMGLGLWLNMDGASGDKKETEDHLLEQQGFGSEATCNKVDFDKMYKAITKQPPKITDVASLDITSLI